MELKPTFHCLRNPISKVYSVWFLHNGFDCGIVDISDDTYGWNCLRETDETELVRPITALEFERIDRHASEKIQSLKAISKESTN